ncbi:hypothetical protein [Paraburkholderia sp. RL17-337-BIB-A]|uniref:hypothetical protein n=1 Tax=Paraburkholderia sp. RL17-337-BIB-A TaxID=3031636 RepID=UPI0038B8B129
MQFLFGPLGLGTISMTAEQIDVLEAILYSSFQAAGLTLQTATRKLLVTPGAVIRAASIADFSAADLDLKGMAENLANHVHESAGTFIKYGGAAIIAGEVLAFAPLAVAGAAAVATGLLFGTAEGAILQNASVFGSLDADTRVQWKETVQFFVSNVSANYFDNLLAKYTGVVGENTSNHITAFLTDLSRSRVADKLGEAFARATTSVTSWVSDDYSPPETSSAWLQFDQTPDGAAINATGAISGSSDPWGIQAADAASSAGGAGQVGYCPSLVYGIPCN